ncbi:hypothetical protein N7463_003236 [Penicillium fimorum]|uniref:Uncharacterized protein n=1 Tax=Penicillium fimorum TaxID=1882269 RepID=A0A9W9Y0L2_9EURO|nr:hypothetical protein N7463_003236 [Penicillium fimorum]
MTSDWVLHPENNRGVSLRVGLPGWRVKSCDIRSRSEVSFSFFLPEKSREVTRFIKALRRANEAPPGPHFPSTTTHTGTRPHSSQAKATMQVA